MEFLRRLLRRLRSARKGVLIVTVRVVGGPHAGETKVVEIEDRKTIGRDPERDVSLPEDRKVSRYHAELSAFQGSCYVQDMGSKHGTLVGDTSIDIRIELSPGQVVTVGDSRLEITW